MAFWRPHADSEWRAHEEVRSILQTCCLGQQPAKIILENGLSEARFSILNDKTVQFRIAMPTEVEFTPLSLCFVTFLFSQRTCAFVGKVHEYIEPHVILHVPKRIAVAEGRSSFRVPITDHSKLTVRVKSEDDSAVWDARAIDLSLTGILIAFDAKDPPRLNVGSTVTVELRLGDQVVRAAGIIRRQDASNRYGIFFSHFVVKGEVRPPKDLRGMVRELERTWLQTRS